MALTEEQGVAIRESIKVELANVFDDMFEDELDNSELEKAERKKEVLEYLISTVEDDPLSKFCHLFQKSNELDPATILIIDDYLLGKYVVFKVLSPDAYLNLGHFVNDNSVNADEIKQEILTFLKHEKSQCLAILVESEEDSFETDVTELVHIMTSCVGGFFQSIPTSFCSNFQEESLDSSAQPPGVYH